MWLNRDSEPRPSYRNVYCRGQGLLAVGYHPLEKNDNDIIKSSSNGRGRGLSCSPST